MRRRAGCGPGRRSSSPYPEVLYNLQALRFIAALLVVLVHTAPHLQASGGPAPLAATLAAIGHYGVDLFFVISGFVIWHSTQAQRGGAVALRFAQRRAIRIYSGYWPYFLLALLLAGWLTPELLARKDLLGSLLLIRTPIPELLIPVSWTLTFELYFYALFALLLPLPRHWRLPALLLLAALVIGVQGYALLQLGGYSRETFHEVSQLYRLFASPYLLEFIGGALLAIHYQRLQVHFLPLLLLALALLLFALHYQSALPERSLAPGYYALQRVALFGSSALFLIWGLLVLEQRGWQLLPPVSRYLGAISYSLYLSHTILLSALAALGGHAWIAASGHPISSYLLVILLIVLYSALHYHLAERPLHRWMQKKTDFAHPQQQTA